MTINTFVISSYLSILIPFYALSNQQVSTQETKLTAMLTILELCKEKHSKLTSQILDIQFPLLLISSVTIGKEKTGIMLKSYPKLVSTTRADNEQWSKITNKLCLNIINSSNAIIERWLKRYRHKQIPEWLNPEELKSLINQP